MFLNLLGINFAEMHGKYPIFGNKKTLLEKQLTFLGTKTLRRMNDTLY